MIKGRVNPITISYVASLPTEPVEIHVVDVNTQVEELEEPFTHKFIPLAIPHIKVGVAVTLIDIIIHTFEVFKTPNTILTDTFVIERPRFDFVSLAELVETTSEQHVDDIIIRVEHVAIGD